MSRARPLQRRTPLRSTKPLAGVTPLAKVSQKRRAENRKRRAIVLATFGTSPACAVPGCGRCADDVHEPLTRGRGGSITDPANMVSLCRACHDEITFTEPAWAYDLGLLVHSWDGGDAA